MYSGFRKIYELGNILEVLLTIALSVNRNDRRYVYRRGVTYGTPLKIEVS